MAKRNEGYVVGFSGSDQVAYGPDNEYGNVCLIDRFVTMGEAMKYAKTLSGDDAIIFQLVPAKIIRKDSSHDKA